MQHRLWSRLFTYVPTPTTDDGESVDQKALLKTVDFQIENGVEGVCLFGSTGGHGSFSDVEMTAATAAIVRHVNGRIPVIVGTGARTTGACITLSRHAQEVGCAGVMILPVSYWPLTQDEVRDHYERVAAAVNIPICIYNNPWTTGVDMKPEFIATLARLPNVGCVKESTGDLSRITAIRLLTNDEVVIIAGWESTSLQALLAGAKGWAPVCSNFLPREAMEFYRAAVDQRNLTKARDLWDKLFPLCDFICTKSHIRVAHTGLEIVGRAVGSPRRPLRMLPAADRERLRNILAEAGALRE